jgi:hypothetical protein
LFTPDIAVDARGNVLVLKTDDFSGFKTLASQLKDVPETGNLRDTWQIVHTPQPASLPIDRLLTSPPASSDIFEPASVQGWDKSLQELKLQRPVAGYTHLPQVLGDLVELGREGRNGYVRGKEDKIVLNKVRELLHGVW